MEALPVDRRDFDEGKREDAESLEALWICREGATFAQVGSKLRKTADGILATGASIRTGCLQIPLGCFCPFACRYGVQETG